jgi:putative membrane protein
VWTVVFAAWHVPAAYELALRAGPVHVLQHASFGLAGVLVWAQLVDPARRGRLTLPARLAFAGALFGLGQVLGNVLLLAPEPFYSSYRTLQDQQHAGLVMMGEQLLTLGFWTLLLLQRGGFFRLSSPAAHGSLTPAGRI